MNVTIDSITLGPEEPLELDNGAKLAPVTIAFATYGRLNAARSNAVLICHALTMDQHVASRNPLSGKPGWWEDVVGAGKAIDTDRYFVICANVLGGCMGTTGPASLDPATGRPWELRFPVITIGDMVRAQVHLIDHFGIDQLVCVLGGSMGGMQVLEWAARHGDRLRSAVAIATAPNHSPQNIAFHEVGRQAIMADPDWLDGQYARFGKKPARGLAVARMAAHITYLSAPALEQKFGRRLQDRVDLSFSFDADFQIESYLRHQGERFVDRFDANCYLYITRAMDYFDLSASTGGDLAAVFTDLRAPVLLLSFTSDWLYPTAQSVVVKDAMARAGVPVRHLEIPSDKGHDAFLLDEPGMTRVIRDFMADIDPA